MKPSQIAELAAAITAGSLTYDAVVDQLDDDGDVSLLDRLLAGGTGGIVGSVVPKLMRDTGVSDLVDDLFDFF